MRSPCNGFERKLEKRKELEKWTMTQLGTAMFAVQTACFNFDFARLK